MGAERRSRPVAEKRGSLRQRAGATNVPVRRVGAKRVRWDREAELRAHGFEGVRSALVHRYADREAVAELPNPRRPGDDVDLAHATCSDKAHRDEDDVRTDNDVLL